MNAKRWIAIAAAAVVLVISVLFNSAYTLFQSNLGSGIDEYMALEESDISENVIEEGSGNSRIAVLEVEGTIQDTGDASSLLGSTGYNHDFFMKQLEQVREDDTVKAVVLNVDTPGGGTLESSQIHDEIVEIQEEAGKPVYVSMGSMAASGGYYISAPAEKIFVSPETLTGSIGVIMQGVNYSELAERIGIDFETIKSGPYKDIMSANRDMTEEERALMQEIVDQSYNAFVDVVMEGRDLSEEEVRAVADGRILNGRQAVEADLADEFGLEEDAISQLREDYDLANAQVFEYGAPGTGLGSLLSMKVNSFLGNDMETKLVAELLSNYNSPRLMYLYGEE
ncbi:signal peptide peptidase SppA [Planococcus salinus]|uniref:Signal peptide peptidase SppA n=1 Tax=Planococcus salinus TaxID=1848460 RepID=A0A3M8PAV2_9BACL|nr:signal peptide peptidase SppA [Planococcus salinus]RNF40828.1 signal peptide peptidase SppA [Planococcus salinus]